MFTREVPARTIGVKRHAQSLFYSIKTVGYEVEKHLPDTFGRLGELNPDGLGATADL
jgi:hypothetical protein